MGGQPTAGEVLARIRRESRDESEKGRWFEQLFMRLALQEPELEISDIHRWSEWPDRTRLTALDGRDIGIDLVAERSDSSLIAVQCKCYDEEHRIGKRDVDSFLAASQLSHDGELVFSHRWVVSTCRWGPLAQREIDRLQPGVSQIDFREYLNRIIEEKDAARPVRLLLPRQQEAVDAVVDGFTNHDRGRLVMACGTGKTFTALRIADRTVENGGRILFAAPTIALVSQARREWLRHTTRPLDSLVVCSDPSAGGRGEDIRRSELECPVTTDPASIASFLKKPGNTRAVFGTYHSLGRVTEAQTRHGAPAFDLAIADEAHRTTGVDRSSINGVKIDFQEKRFAPWVTPGPRITRFRLAADLGRMGLDTHRVSNKVSKITSRHLVPLDRAFPAHALVHDSKLTVNDPNPEARHRPILYDSGRPSSVIWFRTLHATTDSATRPPRDRARSRSPRIDLYRKNALVSSMGRCNAEMITRRRGHGVDQTDPRHRVIGRRLSQRAGHDHTGPVHAEMELPPAACVAGRTSVSQSVGTTGHSVRLHLRLWLRDRSQNRRIL